MERDFGSEMVKTFGARLKRIYAADEAALPREIVVLLESLTRAEAELAARSAQQQACSPQQAPEAAKPGA